MVKWLDKLFRIQQTQISSYRTVQPLSIQQHKQSNGQLANTPNDALKLIGLTNCYGMFDDWCVCEDDHFFPIGTVIFRAVNASEWRVINYNAYTGHDYPAMPYLVQVHHNDEEKQ